MGGGTARLSRVLLALAAAGGVAGCVSTGGGPPTLLSLPQGEEALACAIETSDGMVTINVPQTMSLQKYGDDLRVTCLRPSGDNGIGSADYAIWTPENYHGTQLTGSEDWGGGQKLGIGGKDQSAVLLFMRQAPPNADRAPDRTMMAETMGDRPRYGQTTALATRDAQVGEPMMRDGMMRNDMMRNDMVMDNRRGLADGTQQTGNVVLIEPNAGRRANMVPKFGVQLAAYRSAQRAEKGWQFFAQRLTQALSGRERTIKAARVRGRTYYRLMAAAASRADAAGLCQAVRRRGLACLVREL